MRVIIGVFGLIVSLLLLLAFITAESSSRSYDGYLNGVGFDDPRLIYERLDKQAELIRRLVDRVEKLERRR